MGRAWARWPVRATDQVQSAATPRCLCAALCASLQARVNSCSIRAIHQHDGRSAHTANEFTIKSAALLLISNQRKRISGARGRGGAYLWECRMLLVVFVRSVKRASELVWSGSEPVWCCWLVGVAPAGVAALNPIS